ncbi:ankyrin repeat domain-containing protein [Priestia abyssalis]|uniref:ankyrin repeat domain-containing protein n=1 Tax=Priestia abyssalis TaxID=1221450 RepID=UPI001116CADF|nr:ankyrin repeat domain-containing protein [Priestia abyssalis]
MRIEADAVSKLIEKDANINAQDSKGRTATMIVAYNNVETVKVLIKAGTDVNIPDNDNVTRLQHAREKGFSSPMRMAPTL